MPCFILHHPGLPNWEHNSWVWQLGWASLSNISTKIRFEKEHMLFHFNIQFPTQIGKKGSVPWCCKLHASHRSRRKHPQRYNEPNSLVTSTTSCTNLLHTRTIQCKEFVLRSLRPRTPAFDKQTSLSHRHANWTVKLTMNISIPTQITTPNEPSSARPSTDALASIFTLNL